MIYTKIENVPVCLFVKKKWAQILQTFDAREGMHVRIETVLLENILVLFCDFRSIALVPGTSISYNADLIIELRMYMNIWENVAWVMELVGNLQA